MTNQGPTRLEAIILTIDPSQAPDAIDPDDPRSTQQHHIHSTPAIPPSSSGGAPPKNWLVESILVTLFCCLPFGVVGIINAANVNSKYSSGDFQGAQKASLDAKRWTRIGFFVGIGLATLWFLYTLVVGGAMLRYF